MVYGLATSRNPSDIVVGLHYRISVSANGRVEHIDPLSRGPMVIHPGEGLPAGYHSVGFHCTCMVSDQPVETLVYVTLLHNKVCAVATADGTIWFIEKGKVTKGGKEG